MIRFLGLVMGALLMVFAGPAQAQLPPTVTYEVRSGDTLIGIAQRYLVGANAAPKLQRANGITNPRRLPVGKALKIERSLLRFEGVELQVAEFSGQVDLAGMDATRGALLKEGQTVATGSNGFITFSSSNGGRISLPSNSRARLISARRYVLGDTLYVNFAIEKGRGSITSPKLKEGDQLLLTTPRAVTAVRGTDFRVAFDDIAGRSITEVTEGVVAVSAGDDRIQAKQGFGVATSETGLAEPEALLPAPALVDAGAIQTGELLKFRVEKGAGAIAHRVQVAREAGFVDVLDAKVIEDGEASFEGLPNGRYYVRARAISPSGIEGFSSDSQSFRRKRLGISASTGPSDFVDGYAFKWLPEGDPQATFAFQLWRGDNPDALIVDEAGLVTTDIVLTDLPPGSYQWRVAAVQAEEEGLLKVWGPTQKLTVSGQ